MKNKNAVSLGKKSAQSRFKGLTKKQISDKMSHIRKGKVKIDPKFFKELKYEVKMPTITCWCGKEILDTPSNRLRVKMGKSCFRKGKKIQ